MLTAAATLYSLRFRDMREASTGRLLLHLRIRALRWLTNGCAAAIRWKQPEADEGDRQQGE